MAPITPGLRLAEVLASLSLASDLGTGQPLGHGLRSCRLAVAIAEEMGCDDETVRSVYALALLRFLGCTADSADNARAAGGDDLAFLSAMAPVFVGGRADKTRAMLGVVGVGEPLSRRAGLLIGAFADARAVGEGLAAHCEVAAMLAHRLGLGERVVGALRHIYERWDGKGHPGDRAGEAIPIEVRISTVARDVDLFATAGTDPAGMAKVRRGKGYDPAVVDAWAGLRPEHGDADWDELMSLEPEPHAIVEDPRVALTALADFADLKSPWTRGHSREVARLSRGGALQAGLPASQVDEIEHAALVHDVGRVGVRNGIWDKPGPLSVDEWEQVRLHPYLTSRVLSRCPSLAGLAPMASGHHERLDGSGYHGAAHGDQLTPGSRIIAAADVLAALLADRPHRPGFTGGAAHAVLAEEVSTGHLGREAVDGVIAGANGAAPPRPHANPAGLTDREIEVLRHIAGGHTNREVATSLFISPKTVGRHVENIYAKTGVSTRAGAAVYAMEHGLLS